MFGLPRCERYSTYNQSLGTTYAHKERMAHSYVHKNCFKILYANKNSLNFPGAMIAQPLVCVGTSLRNCPQSERSSTKKTMTAESTTASDISSFVKLTFASI